MVHMKQMKRAEQYHHYHVLSFGWSVLYEPYRQLKVKESAVHAQRQWNLLKSCWCQWLQLLDMVQARDERRCAFARTHYYAVLKVKMLARWQEGARVLKSERRAHLRRLDMRLKVDGWLKEDMMVGKGRRDRTRLLPLSKNPYDA
jgi:hypothetical protein